LRAAAVQLNSTAEKAANMEAADRLTRAAVADGARLIVLPEKWSVLGSDEDLRAGAETLDGPAISWAREIARELSIDLVAGSIAERLQADRTDSGKLANTSGSAGGPANPPGSDGGVVDTPGSDGGVVDTPGSDGGVVDTPGSDDGRLANTSVHIDPSGEIRAVYRKLHMFDVEVEGRAYRESAVTEPGEEIVLSSTAEGVELGLSICYDLRFPELYRILALRGARVLALPSAFTLPTTRDHWDTLVRARAIENQTFVIAANQVGRHPGGHHSGGRSAIVDPWGAVLAQAHDREGHIAADLDLEEQERIRARFPALANRRPETYRWPVEALR
jgi:predicted amidohydrolase